MLPFRLLRDQLVLIATSTAQSIRAWRNGEVQTKAKFFEHELAATNLTNSRIVLLTNLITVVAAVALSAFFLVAADPFSLQMKNRELHSQMEGARKSEADARRIAEETTLQTSALAARLRDAEQRESQLKAMAAACATTGTGGALNSKPVTQ